MKKIITLTSALCIYSTILFAQATPNASFDNWTHNSFPGYDTPNSWDNLNPATGLTGVFTCFKATAAADVHTGSAALKLITKSVFGQDANGIATTGTINTTTQTISGGIAYTLRPDSIVGWYKCTPVSGDNGFAEILLLGSGGISDTIGHARFLTPATTVSTWTRFSVPIDYYNMNPVVKSIWILSSSKDAVTHNVGSTAFFDDLDLIFVLPTAITEQTFNQISIYPNPVSDYLTIKNNSDSKSVLSLFDMAGRKVAEEKIESDLQAIKVSSLAKGMYIYTLSNAQNSVIKTGKEIIQ